MIETLSNSPAAQRDRRILRIWAKAGKGDTPHPLICHVLDTASIAYRLYDLLLGPEVRRQLTACFSVLSTSGDPAENARRWVAVLCGLHDIGKASPAFQALRRLLALLLHGGDERACRDIEAVPALAKGPRLDTPHGVLTAVHLERRLNAVGADPSFTRLVAYGLGGHHGVILDPAQVRYAADKARQHGGKRWARRVDELIERVLELWGLPAWDSVDWPKARLDVAGAVGLAGLASVSDWIASDSTNFPWAGVDVDLDLYHVRNEGRSTPEDENNERAKKAIDRLDWTPWMPPADTGFAALFPDSTPRPVQAVVERMLAEVTEPGLLIIEAPTGEGKTKASVQCAAALVRRLDLAGVYLGMPTRATGNQTYEALADLVASHQQDLRIRLLHGAADEYLRSRKRLRRSGSTPYVPEPKDVGPDEQHEDAKEIRDWFAGKRGLIVPFGTGTVDQILMAVIQARHSFVRLAGLSNKVVVIDEVHGYDLYMSTLLDVALRWLGAMGVPVILMSATLPSDRKAELVRAWRSGRLGLRPAEVPPPVLGASYPELTWADAKGVRTWRDVSPRDDSRDRVSRLNAERVLRMRVVEEDATVRADWLLDRVAECGSVAVMHNLFRRVGETTAALGRAIEHRRARDDDYPAPEIITITGRMTASERTAREEMLTSLFGPGNTPTRPTIVVGTQVLEQGIDLSFHTVLSDLAPIDALLQRAGRMRRHEERGPDSPPLEFFLTGVTEKDDDLALPAHAVRIYPKVLFLRTWAVLRKRTQADPEGGLSSRIHCPDQVRDVIDDVYASESPISAIDGWEKAWAAAETAYNGARPVDVYRPRLIAVAPPGAPDAFPRLTVNPTAAGRTRKESTPNDDRPTSAGRGRRGRA